MDHPVSRRSALNTFAAALATACANRTATTATPARAPNTTSTATTAAPARVPNSTSTATTPAASETQAIARLEARIGGRVGFFALATETETQLAYRADERFAMASTFKWILAAAVLVRVDRKEIALRDSITYNEKDLLDYAPVTRENLKRGALSIEELAAASITVSDNTAANLLLPLVGGPPGLTRFLRQHGDTVTRLDRTEPMLNTNLPGDERDTTSPRAMSATLRSILLGETVLSEGSRKLLIGWMETSKTGKDRLRAGLPTNYRVADKTGSGANAAINNVAIVWPPGRPPLVLASYLSGSTAPMDQLNAAHAELARLASQALMSA